MVDEALIQLYADRLVNAAGQPPGDNDVILTARALARDLSETDGIAALEVLSGSWRCAVRDLDESDLDAVGFASALHQLARIRALVEAMLPSPARTRHLTG